MNHILWLGLCVNALAFIFQMINLHKLRTQRFKSKYPPEFIMGKFEIINKTDGFCDAHIQIEDEVSKGDYILMEVTEINE